MNQTYILITGAAKGLGRAIALELSHRKHSLILHYRQSFNEVEEVAKQCRSNGVEAHLFQGDFSSEERTTDFIERYLKTEFRTKGLINNVGEYFIGSFEETDSKKWRGLFETNLHAPYALSTALCPSLKKERGRIVNIGCVGIKSVQANTYAPAYRATKLGLAFMTLSLAKELAPYGVTVNMISPGHLENSADLPSKEKLPMGRPGSLDEVAKMVAFFFEKESEYITGQNIEIAGGIGL